MKNITMPRPVAVHSLAYHSERGEETINRTHVDSYTAFPAEGAELIRELAAGATPFQTAKWYGTTYGTDVDMSDFLDRPGDPTQARHPVRRQGLGRAVCSPFA
ncbi:hypothetical protein [Nonomuraea sp. SYSU D8015]|uniref:hypothetical protein n=1 Tax=Nonomuraea sp. SYSU D8015 TaxID=2593644 RepID=UPI0016601FA8|nr:hypothetical protein [Nonomuraea sp. SYSU D8015]